MLGRPSSSVKGLIRSLLLWEKINNIRKGRVGIIRLLWSFLAFFPQTNEPRWPLPWPYEHWPGYFRCFLAFSFLLAPYAASTAFSWSAASRHQGAFSNEEVVWLPQLTYRHILCEIIRGFLLVWFQQSVVIGFYLPICASPSLVSNENCSADFCAMVFVCLFVSFLKWMCFAWSCLWKLFASSVGGCADWVPTSNDIVHNDNRCIATTSDMPKRNLLNNNSTAW